jgi:tRNA/rRNA methyltransferase
MNFMNLRIVLVRPQYSGNIGAVARAMRNFSVNDLALVNPAPVHRAQADMMAVHAREVLDLMQIHSSVQAAVADCGLVVGTTCRSGLYRENTVTPRTLAPYILAMTATNRVALVFGCEDSGLSNDELRHCHRLMTIPTDATYTSLNVAQAVLLCCYEVFHATHEDGTEVRRSLAVAERQELMYEKLKHALLKVGFLHKENPEHIMFAFRRIFGRAGLEERDVRILLGMARQIEWYATRGWRLADPPPAIPSEPLG